MAAMTTGVRLDFIPAQTIKVQSAYRVDLTQFIVAGVHVVGSTGRARAWKVNIADLSDAGEITFPNEIGKDDSVSPIIIASGDVLFIVSEAAPGGGGATASPVVYRVAGVFGKYETVDTAARWQALAATNMAHAAQRTADAALVRIDALDERVTDLESA